MAWKTALVRLFVLERRESGARAFTLGTYTMGVRESRFIPYGFRP